MRNEVKKYEQLELKDDFLFSKVMGNRELCKKLLETILNVKIKDIVYQERQKTIDVAADAKGVRLDVYLADESHTIYDVEMQAVKRHNLPKRSRYYQGMIDLEWLEAGAEYNELNHSYIIFICTFDIFGEDRHIYTFENYCKENKSLALHDGTTKIFLNAKGKRDDVNDDMKAFLNYLVGEKVKNEFVDKINDEVIRARNNMKWRREYMTLEMKYREFLEDGREEGREIGLEEGKEIGIMSLIGICIELSLQDDYILQKLVEDFELSTEQAEKYLNQYGAAANGAKK